MIIIEAFHEWAMEWQWRAILVIGGTRRVVFTSNDTFITSQDAMRDGEETITRQIEERLALT